MSASFTDRLAPVLPRIVAEFDTPFHIYDEQGILDGGHRLNRAFDAVDGFREFFAIKALPNLRILEILRSGLGFGFDCSSIAELRMARHVGAGPGDIFFSSNNTAPVEYLEADAMGGCILNLDDATFVDKAPSIPPTICFRVNPGGRAIGNSVIGKPEEAKFGLRPDQLVGAYSRARERGAQRFGIHAMVVTNESDQHNLLATVRMLLDSCSEVGSALRIRFDFINMGGGISIHYRPAERAFELEVFADRTTRLLAEFREAHGHAPSLFMECGRLVTGPHGVLVTKVLNVMSKHRELVGVDACLTSLMRPAMYADSYNHISVVGRDGEAKEGNVGRVDVVGSLCENNDKFAEQILLPPLEEGDLVLVHDTGAHGLAMGFQYNGRLRPKELLLRRDGSVELIRRDETVDDFLRTQLDFEPRLLRP